jgi:hypothetical protein
MQEYGEVTEEEKEKVFTNKPEKKKNKPNYIYRPKQ